ncbi:MAG: hypothetical protein HS119_03795 [Flavobacteriales bacterium]|nr:hypothetical protein [Flavobacteriales bacterium]
MKKFSIILGTILFQINLYAQWKAEVKLDEFKQPTGEFQAFTKSEVRHNNQLIFTIITVFDLPEDSTKIQEPYTFYLFRPKYQDDFITRENSYLSILDEKNQKHRINLKLEDRDARVKIEDTEKLTELLKINTKIKCIVIEEEQMQFMFTINCIGFTKAYNTVKTTTNKKTN